ncbi:MAG: sensor histidine kinase N-terminal domain-containing protein, partial [Cryomorphaceae bacterium]|nr:sensor histidine kinase N-terminal domain-containing protein [Cryomorphaceae bacterium]
MFKSIRNLLAILLCLSSLAAQSAWDISESSSDRQLFASAQSLASDGELRFVKQMASNDKPNKDGFLYVESIAQYSCTKQAYQIVLETGYKTWDAAGQQVDKNLGVWKQIENGSPEQSLLNKMCVTYLAKDINTNAGK